MTSPMLCASVACRRVRAEGSAYCDRHGARRIPSALHPTFTLDSAEYEAARIHDPHDCAACRWAAKAPERAARRHAPVPRDVPELGDEFDTHGSGGMYDDGWWRDDTGTHRKDRMR